VEDERSPQRDLLAPTDWTPRWPRNPTSARESYVFCAFSDIKNATFTFFEMTGQKVVISRPRSFEMTAVKMNSKY